MNEVQPRVRPRTVRPRRSMAAGSRRTPWDVSDACALLVREADVPRLAAHGSRLHVVQDASPEGLRQYLQVTGIRYGICLLPWAELGVALARMLAELGCADLDRGFGVWPLGIALPGRVGAAPTRPRAIARLGTTGAALWVESRVEAVAHGELLQRVAGGLPLSALVITGHGDEQRVSLGERWLAASEDPRFGPTVAPASLRSEIVFLNTCSGARLGDSIVPERCSLARALVERGAHVIGAFRNTSTSGALPEIFCDELLAGLPLGSTVSALNRHLASVREEPPSLLLVGDPSHRLPPVRASNRSLAPFVSPAAAPIEPLLERLSEQLELHTLLRRWQLPLRVSSDAPAALFDCLGLVGRLADAEVQQVMGESEIARIVDHAERIACAIAGQIADDVIGQICQGHWLQTFYAPLSRKSLAGTMTCERCGERCVRYQFEPRTGSGGRLFADECDRCGSLRDALGEGAPPRDLSVECSDGRLSIRVEPLDAAAVGRLAIHRGGAAAVRPWPASGGRVEIPLSGLSLRGRTTVAALQVAANGLFASYQTLFIEPDAPARAQSAPTGGLRA